MNKEKEYLEDLDHYDEGMGIHSSSYEKCKERLIRLAQIDSAEPSKAIKCLSGLEKTIVQRDGYITYFLKIKFDNIKAALLKSQETEKVLDDKLLFKDNSITCGFDYKGKQVVAMPLDEYSRLMKQEKILEIIKEKNVDVDMIKNYQTVIEYNWNIRFEKYKRKELTKEEFELLKRWLGNGNF